MNTKWTFFFQTEELPEMLIKQRVFKIFQQKNQNLQGNRQKKTGINFLVFFFAFLCGGGWGVTLSKHELTHVSELPVRLLEWEGSQLTG